MIFFTIFVILNNVNMNNIVKRFFRRLYVRFIIWQKYKIITENNQKNSNESICLSICRKLITHPKSEFVIAPISDKRYIKNKQLGLFVVLNGGQVSITNHIYHYDVTISQREWDKIINSYNLKTEKIRKEYEDEIHSQIEHSLHTILDKITTNS
jgi:hypothetical protein